MKNQRLLMIKHIMVPYDKSEPANRALQYAIDLAKKYNSSLSIVSCISTQIPTDPYFGTAYMENINLLKEDAVKAISNLEPLLRESKISLPSHCFSWSPEETFLNSAYSGVFMTMTYYKINVSIYIEKRMQK